MFPFKPRSKRPASRHTNRDNRPSVRSRSRKLRLQLEPLEPREMLAVLSDPMIVGGVTDTEAKVFLRTDEAADVAVQFATNPSFAGAIQTPTVSSSAASDFTTILTLGGLSAETQYYYRAVVDGVAQADSVTHTFTASPIPDTVAEFSFAVMSDVSNARRFPTVGVPAYETISNDGAAFVLQVGDFDHRNPRSLRGMRIMNQQMRNETTAAGSDFAEFIAPSLPFYHVWDDHDFGANNADKTFAGKASALQVYDEYFPTTDRPNPNGIWHGVEYAQTEFFMLDVRSQRDPSADADGPDKSMLDGDTIADDQLDWLKDGLQNSTATWKFLVSGVPFNATTKPEDSWAAYGRERQELLDFIDTNGITGVVVLSGDLHSGGALDDGTNADLPEMSVPHTNLFGGAASSGPPGTWSDGFVAGNLGGGYALVTVRGNELVLETRAADGTIRNSMTLAAPGPPIDTVGPVSTGLLVTPNPATAGPLSIAVTVDETSTGGGTITAAEYFVDSVGATGTGTPLLASDGNFDSITETVAGSISVSTFDNLATGGHTLYVRGQDAAGNWGATTSTLFQKQSLGSLDPFIDVIAQSGIAPLPNVVFGTSWLDFNNDGLPDLYVGKHLDGAATGEEPNLWINQGNGFFLDQFSTAFPNGSGGDTHGNQWVDFDNDGDQDLLQIHGGQGGTGSEDNAFLINNGGQLTNQIAGTGLELGPGRGRDPFWFDWNGDGLLDVLIANDRHPDLLAPSGLFEQQTDGTFVDVTAAAGMDFTGLNGDSFRVGDLNNDGLADVAFLELGDPIAFYAGQVGGGFALQPGFLPSIDNHQELVIADLNGDGFNDAFIARAKLSAPNVYQFEPTVVGATLRNRGSELGMTFKSSGDLTFVFRKEQVRSGQVAIERMQLGAGGANPSSVPFTVSTSTPGIEGIQAHPAGGGNGLYVGYDSATDTWEVTYSDASFSRLDFYIESTSAITDLDKVNFLATDESAAQDVLLLYNPATGQLEDQTAAWGIDGLTSATSVVAVDIDNDMDLDLYVGQETALGGLPDLLYINDGNGGFQVEVVGATVLPNGSAADPLQLQGLPHVAHFGDGTKVLAADFDVDGFVDLYLNGTKWPAGALDVDGSPSQLLQNQGNANRWIEIDLVGVTSNRDAIGTKVSVTAGGITQVRDNWGGKHRVAQDSMRIHVGLGSNTTIDQIDITWPSGIQQTLTDVAVDQVITIVEESAGQDLLGPLSSSVGVTPSAATSGPLDVSATLSDVGLGNSPLVAAEFFIDLIGVEGSGTALAAVDGTWDSVSEDATGSIGVATFEALSTGSHTVYVRGLDDAGNWGAVAQATFEKQSVAATSVYYLTTTAGGSVTSSDGSTLSFQDRDILELTIATSGDYSYAMYFDGSDVGLNTTAEDLDAIHLLPNGDIVVSTLREASVNVTYATPGVGSGAVLNADRYDLLQFTPTSLGTDTAGNWSLRFDGSAQGLDSNRENIDAVSILDDGTLLISTVSNVAVPGVSGSDKDILAFDPATSTWSLYFDGSDIPLSTFNEDINAFSVNAADTSTLETMVLSVINSLDTPEVTGGSNDAFTFQPTSLGATSAGTFDSAPAFRGADVGLGTLRIGGLAIAPPVVLGQAVQAPKTLALRSTPQETQTTLSAVAAAQSVFPQAGTTSKTTIEDTSATEMPVDETSSASEPTVQPRRKIPSPARDSDQADVAAVDVVFASLADENDGRESDDTDRRVARRGIRRSYVASTASR